MEFNIESEKTPDGVAVIEVAGELDLYTAPRLKEALLSAMDEGVLNIIVDMSGVHFIDSSALGVLIGGVKRLKPKEGKLVLVSVDENVNWIFQITGLNSVFDIFQTREEALAGVH
ncbi:MAG: STAS domain-containing protein [Thermoleophilia bacterium]|jgi:anti-sigma B factor antagonist|nr:STAS domain-containing protein [Actinomycetota bacterium]MDA8166397.1 STAS domain-containing protein [Actinomycetota bacterium]